MFIFIYLLVQQFKQFFISRLCINGPNWDFWDVIHSRNVTNTGILSEGGVLQGPMWQLIRVILLIFIRGATSITNQAFATTHKTSSHVLGYAASFYYFLVAFFVVVSKT